MKTLVSLDHIPVGLITLLVLLAPVFVIPDASFPVQFSKTFAIALVALFGLIFFIASQLRRRTIEIPYHPLILGLWLLPLAYLLSTIFSKNIRLSLFGQNLEADTLIFIVLGAILATLVALLFKSVGSMFRLYTVLFISFLILALYHVIRLVLGGDVLSFGIFTNPDSTPIGAWNDLAVFAGLIATLSLILLTSTLLRGILRYVLYGTLVVALFFIMLINFSVVWWIVGFFALATFVYSVIARGSSRESIEISVDAEGTTVREERSGPQQISFVSLIVLALVLIFLFFSTGVGNYLSSTFRIETLDVRPSWASTIDIGKATFSDNPIFGSGPNTFSKQWQLEKPLSINETIFWNTTFSSAVGFIPTSFITSGIVGIVAWLLFFSILLLTGFRTFVLRSEENEVSSYLSLSSFIGALYLWIAAVVYTPSAVLMTLAFVLTGVFLGSLRFRNDLSEILVSFTANPRLGFVLVLLLTIIFLGSIAGLFSIGQKYVAAVWFQDSIVLSEQGKTEEAISAIADAAALDDNDRFYRRSAREYLSLLTSLLSETTISTEELQSRFQNLVGNAVQNSQNAVRVDGTNSENWLVLGDIYGALAPLQIEGAYENATRAFTEAKTYSPNNPSILFEEAQLEATLGNTARAKDLLNTALKQKSNYTDATFLLAQIQVSEGSAQEAIRSVEAVTLTSPGNPVAFFQLGLLHYSSNTMQDAIKALERAVTLDQSYSNARYFLGLAYYRIGRTEDAIEQFEVIEVFNPNNDGVKQILENLRAGRAPVPGIERAAVSDLEGLPIEEE